MDLVIVGIISVFLGWWLFIVWERHQAHSVANRIHEYAVKESRKRRNQIFKKFLDEKSTLRFSAQNLLHEIQDSLSNLQQILQKQERKLNEWRRQLEIYEVDIEEKKVELEEVKSQYSQQQESLQTTRKNVFSSLLDYLKLDHQKYKEEAAQKLHKDLQSERELYYNRRADIISENCPKLCNRILQTTLQRYRRNHRGEIYSSTIAIDEESTWENIAEHCSYLENKLECEIKYDDTSITVVDVDGYKRELVRRLIIFLLENETSLEDLDRIIEIHDTEITEEMENLGNEVGDRLGLEFAAEVSFLLGRLQYRTSYGQNVLYHSVEVAYLSKVVASEIGLDPMKALRSGLLHDLGKALDHELKGGHPEIGANILAKYNEDFDVLEGVLKHHESIRPETPYATIVSAADAMSASRPGARRETLEKYIERLENLESLARDLEGVENVFAISAGRELRVIVDPEVLDDEGTVNMAKDIALKVETELQYPGKIKIVVIREKKISKYAR